MEFHEEICTEKHKTVEVKLEEHDRRISVVEKSLQDNFVRVYDKLDKQTLHWAEEAAENAKRPGWATTAIITVLTALVAVFAGKFL